MQKKFPNLDPNAAQPCMHALKQIADEKCGSEPEKKFENACYNDAPPAILPRVYDACVCFALYEDVYKTPETFFFVIFCPCPYPYRDLWGLVASPEGR